jgi:hypothetical protein
MAGNAANSLIGLGIVGFGGRVSLPRSAQLCIIDA